MDKIYNLVLFICVFLRMPPKAATLTRATRSGGASLEKTLPAMSTPAKRGPKGKKEVVVAEPEVVIQTPSDVARKKVAALKAAVDAADAQRAKDVAALDAAAQDLEDCVVKETKPMESEDRKRHARSRSRSPRRRSYSPRRRSFSPGRLNIPVTDIQALGRWMSEAFMYYVRSGARAVRAALVQGRLAAGKGFS